VAVAQVNVGTSLGDASTNLERHLEAVSLAQEKEADLIIFPELSLSGYHVPAPAEWSKRHLRGAVAALTDVAGGAAIVVGAPVAQRAGGATNAALVITGDGIIHRQDKLYLPNYNKYDEGDRFEKGRTLNLVDIAGFHIGIIICEDAWHPSLAYLARLKGADVLVHPAARCRVRA
jgi:predicted amidohydrolase